MIATPKMPVTASRRPQLDDLPTRALSKVLEAKCASSRGEIVVRDTTGEGDRGSRVQTMNDERRRQCSNAFCRPECYRSYRGGEKQSDAGERQKP